MNVQIAIMPICKVIWLYLMDKIVNYIFMIKRREALIKDLEEENKRDDLRPWAKARNNDLIKLGREALTNI